MDIGNKEKELQEHPVLALLFYMPAIPITAIMIIPLSIIFIPIIYLFKKHEVKIMRFSLYLQNACGLAGWLVIEEWLISQIPLPFFSNISINWIDFLIALVIALIIFYAHIKRMVEENLCKTYGNDWKSLL